MFDGKIGVDQDVHIHALDFAGELGCGNNESIGSRSVKVLYLGVRIASVPANSHVGEGRRACASRDHDEECGEEQLPVHPAGHGIDATERQDMPATDSRPPRGELTRFAARDEHALYMSWA